MTLGGKREYSGLRTDATEWIHAFTRKTSSRRGLEHRQDNSHRRRRGLLQNYRIRLDRLASYSAKKTTSR
jgi:hypothetical protein